MSKKTTYDIQESIRTFLTDKYIQHIDMTDDKDSDTKFFGRALAGYILEKRIGLQPNQSSIFITDGEADNGIDAIYFDQKNSLLYFLQTKFPQEKDSGAKQAEFLKFKRGVDLITQLNFKSFNPKIQAQKEILTEAFTTATDLKLHLIFATAGGEPGDTTILPIQEFVAELNKREGEQWVSYENINHDDVWDLISNDKLGSSQNITLEVFSHGETEDSSEVNAVYGQIRASDLANLIKKYSFSIFSENIRTFLGSSGPINEKIKETLINSPENFLFLNNGITAVCSDIKKSKIQGSGSKTFTFDNFKIINGAQTSGTVYQTHQTHPVEIDKARVLLKVIGVASGREKYVRKITVASNSQNKIEALDFASLDPVQIQLESKLRKDFDISYLRLRGEPTDQDEKIIPMEEAAFALCSLQSDVTIPARLKREKSLFWENTDADPYKLVFNSELSTKRLVNSVWTYRAMRQFISAKQIGRGRERGYSMSADYFLLHLVFQKIPKVHEQIDADPSSFRKIFNEKYKTNMDLVYSKLWSHLSNTDYQNQQLPKLFITPAKVVILKEEILKIINS